MTFNDLEFRPHSGMPGIQAVVLFDNSYGASVIKGSSSYGGSQGLYELAVIKIKEEDGSRWDLCYDSGLTEDVEGYLTEDDVTSFLQRIEAL